MNKNYTAMIWGTTIIAVLSTTACQQISASIPGEKAIENTSSLPNTPVPMTLLTYHLNIQVEMYL
jgi:hypothetical protein